MGEPDAEKGELFDTNFGAALVTPIVMSKDETKWEVT